VALEGSLKDFGLADILQLIFFQRKTGVLALEGRADRVRLLFIDGNIVGAESRRKIEANRLGKVLVKKGLLEENDLKSVLEEQRSSNLRFGNILVKRGIVEKEPIQEILTGQIEETVVQIFGWKQGTYEFTPQAVPADKDIPISIDTQHLLMEGLRIVDEWSVIEGKLTLDTVFIKKTEDIAGLSEEEEEILSLVDGENDVSAIIEMSAGDDALVSKILVSLMEKGAIEPKKAAPVVTEAVAIEIKKPLLSYRSIPVLAIAVSFLLSLFPLYFNKVDIFKKFSASESIEDLRFEIEAYKFKHGSYPEILDEISRKSDPWGNPYVYKHNDYAFIILSKGADGKEGTSDDLY
jgi:predicted transcriptional regulator